MSKDYNKDTVSYVNRKNKEHPRLKFLLRVAAYVTFTVASSFFFTWANPIIAKTWNQTVKAVSNISFNSAPEKHKTGPVASPENTDYSATSKSSKSYDSRATGEFNQAAPKKEASDSTAQTMNDEQSSKLSDNEKARQRIINTF